MVKFVSVLDGDKIVLLNLLKVTWVHFGVEEYGDQDFVEIGDYHKYQCCKYYEDGCTSGYYTSFEKCIVEV